MKHTQQIYGPETPNYALLNEAAKGKSTLLVQTTPRVAGKITRKPRKSPRHEQDPSK
jgi:hypothetical protein